MTAKSSTLLIVEDEVIVAHDIKAELERLGYQVCAIANSGEEALERVEQYRPDLVVMDIVLGGSLSGIEAGEIIHQRFETPLIFLTAHADESLLERAKRSEPCGYLIKPFTIKELRFAVEIGLHKAALYQKLRESEELFRLLAQNAKDLIFRYRLKPIAGFDYVSPSSFAITGYTPKEFYANPKLLKQIVHRLDRCLTQEAAMTLQTYGKPIIQRWIRKDGQTIWVEQRHTVVQDDDGAVLAIEGFVSDISERKRMEQVLEVTQEFLKIANRHSQMNSFLAECLSEIKGLTDCAGVGWI